tara:strand:- start:62 stop:709 length:648 start_codon:yes stop_codon:yes gene_type:complete
VKALAADDRFVDAADWAAAGFSGIVEPPITQEMVDAHASMVADGANPYLVLDPGFSWQYVADNFDTFGFQDSTTRFRLDHDVVPEDDWHLDSRPASWLLFHGAGADYLGIVPGSNSKTYDQDVLLLETDFPNMRLAGPAEFSIAMLIVYKTHGDQICAHPCSARTSQIQSGRGHAAVSGVGFVRIHTLTKAYNHWYFGAVAVYRWTPASPPAASP